MLKVVGASWRKTRIGTYILTGAGLLAFGAFFIDHLERPQYDGTYCSTAFWTQKYGFQIVSLKQSNDLDNIPKGVARICYKDSIYLNGWAQLELETQRHYPDWVQAYAAGILEGSLTWRNIYHQWSNTIASACNKDDSAQNFCTWLRDLLGSSYDTMKDLAKNHSEYDHYWHQINLFFRQLQGLANGYRRGAIRARSDLEEKIPFVDFILMNSAADIQDLKIYFENFILREGNSAPQADKNFFLPSSTMMAKIFKTFNATDAMGWRILFGHTSAGSYSSMLRIQKRYKFRYHYSPDQKSNTVPGVDISFTGYPGILGSTDDFYIIKGRQVHAIVAGVGIQNENLKLWENVDLIEALPLTARVMAANRISQNRNTWEKAMSRHPTTGNKQWLMIDLNGIGNVPLTSQDSNEADDEAYVKRKGGIVWMVEQLPGRLKAMDMTDDFINTNNTWVGNGIPQFDEILAASGVSKENLSNDSDDDDTSSITELTEIDKYLRAHAFRGDLRSEEPVPYGNIDIKLFRYDSNSKSSDFHAFSGPVVVLETNPTNSDSSTTESLANYEQLAELEIITDRRPVRNDMRALAMKRSEEPFKWSTVAKRIPDVGHRGHPDQWNFNKVSPKWAWHD